MTVGLVGTGPATAAVEAALGDTDVAVEHVSPDGISPSHRVAVVVAQAGATTFDRANERAKNDDVPWVAVELGGIGGYPVVDAAVAGFGPDGPCYDCLASRVESNVDEDAEPVSPPSGATARLAGALAGHRACQSVDPGEPDPFGRVLEIPHAERPFLPVPGCGCGGETSQSLDRDYVDRDVDEALTRAEHGLDQRLGIVADIGEAESYPAPYYLAQVCDTSAFSDGTATRQAAGVDGGWDAAFMKALGEAYERYCAGVYRRDEFTHATATELDAPVAPSAFVRPDNWSDNTDGGNAADDVEDADGAERPWMDGESLTTGGTVQIPAEMVHYPPPERTIRPAITTGLGLGNSSVEAILSGLYEVVERDASTIAWYSTYEPLGLVVEDEKYQQLAARAGAEGLDVTALLLTQDVDVPVVAVAVQHDEWPKLALGTAAHLDPACAAQGALAEAVQNWVELREMGPDGAESTSGEIAHYAGRPPEIEGFVDPGQHVPASSVGPESAPTGPDHLDVLLERVTDADLDPYAVRTTTRDIEQLGFEGVRVLVPGAQPLFFDDPYFGERARLVPAEMGFEAAPEREHHPYP